MSESKKEERVGPDLFGAAVLIFLGVVFLLNNFSILPWSIWGELWRFWPVFLIVGGFQMIFGGSYLSNMIVSVFGIVLLIVILLLAASFVNRDIASWLQRRFPLWREININSKYKGDKVKGRFFDLQESGENFFIELR